MTLSLTQEVDLLIARARDGDNDSFNTIISCYRSELVEYAQCALGLRSDAEDAVQNGLLYAWLNHAKMPADPLRVRIWLRACVKNNSRKIIQASEEPCEQAMRRQVDSGQLIRVVWTSTSNPFPAPSGCEDDTDEEIAKKKVAAQIEQAIARLPRAQKEAFELRLDGYTNKEIGKQLNISPLSVNRTLARARRRIRREVDVHNLWTFTDY